MARKYARDNRGRFASKGTGATARGGRLKTAGGNKREGQTIQAAGGRAGTIGKPRGLKPGAIKPKAAAQQKPSRKPAISGQSFERRAAALTPQSVDQRRMTAESRRPMEFYSGKGTGKAAQEFRDRTGQASYNRQSRSMGVAIRAKKFYSAAAQFQSEYTTRPRWSTVRNPGPSSVGAWSRRSESAWSGYKGRGARKGR